MAVTLSALSTSCTLLPRNIIFFRIRQCLSLSLSHTLTHALTHTLNYTLTHSLWSPSTRYHGHKSCPIRSCFNAVHTLPTGTNINSLLLLPMPSFPKRSFPFFFLIRPIKSGWASSFNELALSWSSSSPQAMALCPCPKPSVVFRKMLTFFMVKGPQLTRLGGPPFLDIFTSASAT
jgi:hypothetical protein